MPLLLSMFLAVRCLVDLFCSGRTLKRFEDYGTTTTVGISGRKGERYAITFCVLGEESATRLRKGRFSSRRELRAGFPRRVRPPRVR